MMKRGEEYWYSWGHRSKVNAELSLISDLENGDISESEKPRSFCYVDNDLELRWGVLLTDTSLSSYMVAS